MVDSRRIDRPTIARDAYGVKNENEIRRYSTPSQLSRAVADEFVVVARDAIGQRGAFSVVLAGGSTPRQLYETLALPPFRELFDWQAVRFFWGDERAVPPGHPDSNFRMARDAMLSKLPVRDENIHRPLTEKENLAAAAESYQTRIAEAFGVPDDGDPPAFDLVLLGIGTDGHTASLFPHTPALTETRRWVVANGVPQLNTTRLTLTVPILNRAEHVFFLVCGAAKARALREILAGGRPADELPASLIRPKQGRLIWFVDEEAAKELPS